MFVTLLPNSSTLVYLLFTNLVIEASAYGFSVLSSTSTAGGVGSPINCSLFKFTSITCANPDKPGANSPT